MVSLSKIIGVLSCSFMLSFGMSHAVQADNAGEKHMGAEMRDGDSKGTHTIKGEVLRVEGANYFVKGSDGKEVRLHTDSTTQMGKNIERGERIEAKVSDQNQTLSILSDPAVTDRRNDKE